MTPDAFQKGQFGDDRGEGLGLRSSPQWVPVVVSNRPDGRSSPEVSCVSCPSLLLSVSSRLPGPVGGWAVGEALVERAARERDLRG